MAPPSSSTRYQGYKMNCASVRYAARQVGRRVAPQVLAELERQRLRRLRHLALLAVHRRLSQDRDVLREHVRDGLSDERQLLLRLTMDRFAEICFALATCSFGLLLLIPTLFSPGGNGSTSDLPSSLGLVRHRHHAVHQGGLATSSARAPRRQHLGPTSP